VVNAHGGALSITDGVEGGARFEITGVDIAPEDLGAETVLGDDALDTDSGE